MKKLILIFALILLSCEAETIPPPPTDEIIETYVNEVQTQTIPNTNYLGGNGQFKMYTLNRPSQATFLDTQNNNIRMLNSVWTFRILSQIKNTTIEKKYINGVFESQRVVQEEIIMTGNYFHSQTSFTNRVIKYRKVYGSQVLQYHIDIDNYEWFLSE
jgi:hypothetical protein